MAITDKLIERVKQYEGFCHKPYKDTVGKTTIGYGRNLEANPLSLSETTVMFNRINWHSKKDAEDWAEMLLRHDLQEHMQELDQRLGIYGMCDADEKTVLIDMAYNLGVPTLLTFEGMLHAIDNDDRVGAAVELMDSKYAEQVKTRAIDNAKVLTGADFSEAFDRLETKNPRRAEVLRGYL